MRDDNYVDIVNQAALLTYDEYKRCNWHRCCEPGCENTIQAVLSPDLSGRYILPLRCADCKRKYLSRYEVKQAESERRKAEKKKKRSGEL